MRRLLSDKDGSVVYLNFKPALEYLKEMVNTYSRIGEYGLNPFGFLETEVDYLLYGVSPALMSKDASMHGAGLLTQLGIVTDMANGIYTEFQKQVRAVLENANLNPNDSVIVNWQGPTPYATISIDTRVTSLQRSAALR